MTKYILTLLILNYFSSLPIVASGSEGGSSGGFINFLDKALSATEKYVDSKSKHSSQNSEAAPKQATQERKDQYYLNRNPYEQDKNSNSYSTEQYYYSRDRNTQPYDGSRNYYGQDKNAYSNAPSQQSSYVENNNTQLYPYGQLTYPQSNNLQSSSPNSYNYYQGGYSQPYVYSQYAVNPYTQVSSQSSQGQNVPYSYQIFPGYTQSYQAANSQNTVPYTGQTYTSYSQTVTNPYGTYAISQPPAYNTFSSVLQCRCFMDKNDQMLNPSVPPQNMSLQPPFSTPQNFQQNTKTLTDYGGKVRDQTDNSYYNRSPIADSDEDNFEDDADELYGW